MCALVAGVQTCARPVSQPPQTGEFDAFDGDLADVGEHVVVVAEADGAAAARADLVLHVRVGGQALALDEVVVAVAEHRDPDAGALAFPAVAQFRSEEHTSELQSLMRISYAVLRLKIIMTP